MALMHETTLVPSKYELLAAWLPAQPWFHGDATKLERVGAYRLDDPAGEVGLEGHLFTAGDDTVYHVPLSYRGAPLEDTVEGGDAFLVGVMQHGVLGKRWASDAMGDPVFRAVIAEVMVHGGHEAAEFAQDAAGNVVERAVHTRIQGSGSPRDAVPDLSDASVVDLGESSRAENGTAVLVLHRVAAPGREPGDSDALRVSWPGQADPVVLAELRS